jgi:hypothetical protein
MPKPAILRIGRRDSRMKRPTLVHWAALDCEIPRRRALTKLESTATRSAYGVKGMQKLMAWTLVLLLCSTIPAAAFGKGKRSRFTCVRQVQVVRIQSDGCETPPAAPVEQKNLGFQAPRAPVPRFLPLPTITIPESDYTPSPTSSCHSSSLSLVPPSPVPQWPMIPCPARISTKS